MISDSSPSHAANKLQLGLFATNLERGGTASTMKGTLALTWDDEVRIARAADQMGLELLVPVARWRGFGGVTDYAGSCYDTFCWAAGLAAATESIRLMTTCHVPTIHPLVAAKQLTTIDHISHGRIGLNVVGGWFRPELEMFGHAMLEHDRRYDLAEEWTKILTQLWTSTEPFSYHGDFFSVNDAVSNPKPVQAPRPPIMNAGGSPRGQRFAAEYADMVFLALSDLSAEDLDGARAKVENYKGLARREFGRDIQAWTHMNIVCAETTEEAQQLEREMLSGGDVEAITNMLKIMGVESSVLGTQAWEGLIERFIAGWGGAIVTGDPAHVAQRLRSISDAGFDGCLLIFPQWDEGLKLMGDKVLPLLEDAGLRTPFAAAVRN
jgi:dimethylsulfone monooxygenase